jgi:uncharacterized membrane protein (UPF0136 family)
MKFMPLLVILYAFILIGGGMLGYYKAGSLPSLIMGCITGVILIVSAIGMFNKGLLGYFFSSGIAFAMAVFFTYRFTQTLKLMPTGMMAIISFIVFILLVAVKLKN